MSVGRICTRVVATASPEESVLDVARRMEEYNVGTLVIVDPAQKPLAIVTDRDVVTRCVARGLDAADTKVSVIMTDEARSVNESTPIEQALKTMGGAGVRRLIVTGDHGGLEGLLSLDDVIRLLVEEAEVIGRILGKQAIGLGHPG
jgi:CBS domain-containing protein